MKYPDINNINSFLKRYCSPKYIKYHYPEFYKYLIDTYPFCKKITEAMWLFYNGLTEKPKCKNCGKSNKFRNWTEGYSQYCSQKCMSQQTRGKAKDTMLKKYGGIGWSSREISEKIKNTSIERYGGIGLASEDIRKKITSTMLERYGVENPMKSKDLSSKITSTMLERYGVEHALQYDKFLQKSQYTCMSNHGVFVPSKSKEIYNKIIKTKIDRYGENFSKIEMEKSKNTNLKKYGRLYGFDYKKVKQTNLERYGVENPMISKCSRGEIKFKGYSKSSQEFFAKIDKYLDKKYTTQYATKNGEKKITVDNHNYYVDFYINELKIAIEFNGDTWHGNPSLFKADDKCFPMDSNITAKDLWEMDNIKRKRLESVGIKLVVIWESEYKKCKDVKHWIKDKLNLDI